MSTLEIAQQVQNLFMELAHEPEDLCEQPHPELHPGEVFVGVVEYTADKNGKEHEAYSTTAAMEPFKTRRLGNKEFARSTREDGWTPYDYCRPVFVSREELQTFLEKSSLV